ncbi:putative alkanesulfonate monooxygenase [Aeromicrobium flavum]|uniref:Putative alkanesulfonate monooxygenase n=1 Tax=Aeromicrobium flavum TaxID=416568 RepID=A0A512HVL3_9ACTN|nr:LLM class flavin-dependent oxidoreductase [Aeromicrobium flavum]GEO89482.1 putative alkanesulfonate monooxygenase [Aeromicrobium flavum]
MTAASLRFDWFLPTTGDSRALVGGGHSVPTGVGREAGSVDTAGRYREADLRYLANVARTAEDLGFDAVLTPTGTPCEDAWVVASALIPQTTRLKFLVALRPGLVNPTLLAQMASTFQRLSDNRLLLNVVVGGEPAEQLRFGDRIAKDDRYARAAEFIQVFREAFTDGGSNFTGEYYDVEDARTRRPAPVPEIYLGGSSAAAGPVTAAHTDVYLTWGEPPEAVAQKVEWIRKLADDEGRTVRFGVRLHTITRDRSEDAWRVADDMLAGLDPAEVEKAQRALAASESEGQRRMRDLHGGRFDRADAHSLEVRPGLWAGVGLMRGGAGTALVGSHAEAADLIEQYAAAGIEEFVMSGYPHVEEAYWFAEGVLPILRRRGLVR